jgi:pyruvate/2-oxoglutarate dehydrogenase complex dihydrolipoamide dehydrogenase (E3) component
VIGGIDNEIEKTNINNIYALGDVLDGCPEYHNN